MVAKVRGVLKWIEASDDRDVLPARLFAISNTHDAGRQREFACRNGRCHQPGEATVSDDAPALRRRWQRADTVLLSRV